MENLQYLPVNSDGDLVLTIPALTFGNITLIAKYEPLFADFVLTKAGWNTADVNQTFVFNISGTPDNTALGPINLTVVINGNGTAKIPQLPVGTYTVEEQVGWSWRYSDTPQVKFDTTGDAVTENYVDATDNQIVVSDPTVTHKAKFTNSRVESKWLDGNTIRENIFGAKA